MYIFGIVGFFVLAFVFVDAFLTIFSLRGGGPVTDRISAGFWRTLLSLHARRPMHALLSLAGPLILVFIVMSWFLALSLAWFFIFISQHDAVVVSLTEADTNILEKLYFISVTVSDLGYGDMVPSAFPWTLLSGFAAVSGSLIITASLSYILPVVSAGLEKRVIARRIHELGDSSKAIIGNVWWRGGQSVESYLLDTLLQVQSFTFKHLAYPVLLYFHSAKPDQSLALAMLKLADAFFLVSKGVKKAGVPMGGFMPVALNTIDEYSYLSRQKNGRIKIPSDIDIPDHLSLDTLRNLGFEVVEEAHFQAALIDFLPQRERLYTLCLSDGWDPCDFD